MSPFDHIGKLLETINNTSKDLQEKITGGLKSVLKFIWSPSRWLIDRVKTEDRVIRGDRLRGWSLGLFIYEIVLAILLCIDRDVPSLPSWIEWPIIVIAVWRINEITWAFYGDALSMVTPIKQKEKHRSNLQKDERIRMAMRSIYGLLFNFAVLYYYLPVDKPFKDGYTLPGFFESMYFSGITLATVGYGDISPTNNWLQFLSIYEVFTGILIIAVAIATYVGGEENEDQTTATEESENS